MDETGSGEIFASANANPDRVNLVIPATHFDISDRNFVEVVFWPQALADQPVKSVKAFIPKQEITLIVELESPDALPALGYKTTADRVPRRTKSDSLFLAWRVSYFVFHVAGVLIHLLLVFALMSFMFSAFIGKRGVE